MKGVVTVVDPRPIPRRLDLTEWGLLIVALTEYCVYSCETIHANSCQRCKLTSIVAVKPGRPESFTVNVGGNG